MTPAHVANIALHVAAGTAGLAMGSYILATRKGTAAHRRAGRYFSWFTLIVCASAAVGLVWFRFLPLFAVLTVLVLYQLVSGWRSAHTRERGPAPFDAAWTALAIVGSVALYPTLLSQTKGARVVVYSTLGGLGFILLYDAIRWLFPRRWYATLWPYEHSYKLISSIFAMLSALVGNVVRVGQPWSQLAPSVLGTLVIAYFFLGPSALRKRAL